MLSLSSVGRSYDPLLLLPLALALASCAPPAESGASTEMPGHTDAGVAARADASPDSPATDSAAPANRPFRLAKTGWRLVRIQSMDDTEYTPQDRDSYTLEFVDESAVRVRADCNRGQGTYERTGDSGLQLGPMAVTQALCPPDSLHDRYLSDLSYVRSFIARDGHIFLATMADGAILELEPLGPAFDCARAGGEVEEVICADQELAALDRELDRLYERAVRSYPAEELRGLKAFQRGWIKGRNECWKADDLRECVLAEYQLRITELQIGTGSVVVPKAIGFTCDGGRSVTAVFYENTMLPAAVLTLAGGEQIIAYRQPSASGAKYSGRNVEFWTRGDEARMTWFGEESLCRVRKPGS
jgi:uncharacterized protein/heat shock protein HslJ